MDIKAILIAVGVIAVIGVIIGIVLGIAEKVFHVEVNEKETAVREVLPGSNCGGCGYAGCDAMAAAIASLKSIGYSPEAPTEFSVGVGQYKGKTGIALGFFHYPNKDFMLNFSMSSSSG